MTTISQEARELLASAYDADKKPWFAHDIRLGRSKQFDVPLMVLTNALKPKKYCKYDLPGKESIDHDCQCHWCNPQTD